MAFRSNGPVVFAFPPFRGTTRLIILTTLCGYFGSLLMSLIAPGVLAKLAPHLVLVPAYVMQGQVWELVTYPFLDGGLLSVLFSAMTVWYFGSTLEDERGSSWLSEYFLSAAVGGAVIGVAISFALGSFVKQLSLDRAATSGLWPAALAMLVAFAYANPEQEISFNSVFRIRAKYLAAVYLLVYLAMALGSGNSFAAVVVITNSLAGFCFLRFVSRRGLRYAASERWYGMRNGYYRAKRRRVGKKFEVYMREQGKDVNVDTETTRDPNDKRWMN